MKWGVKPPGYITPNRPTHYTEPTQQVVKPMVKPFIKKVFEPGSSKPVLKPEVKPVIEVTVVKPVIELNIQKP